MTVEIVKMEWDSEFFSYPVGRALLKEFKAEDFQELKSVLNKNNYTLIYTYPLDEISKNTLIDLYKKPVDTKTTFEKLKNNFAEYGENQNIASYREPDQYEKMKELAFISGEFSRYKTDKNFGGNEFERLYTKWLDNSISKIIADDILVYTDNKEIKGMVTYKIKDDELTIGLIAVDVGTQGKGIGKSLMKAVENRAIENNVNKILVSTQEENISATSFYGSCGYTIKEKKEIFHIWLT